MNVWMEVVHGVIMAGIVVLGLIALRSHGKISEIIIRLNGKDDNHK